MKRKFILPAVIIVTVLGFGFKLAVNKQKINAANQPVDRSAFAIPVTTLVAGETTVSGTFSVPGELEPRDQAQVMVNASGKLAYLNVELGSRVSKGQVIGSLDVKQKQLDLAAAELTMNKLKKDDARYRDLYAGKATSEASYDDVHFNYENAKVKVDLIRQQIHDAQVIAPVDGIVVKKNIEVGEYVNPGMMIVEVVDITHLKADVHVSEHEAYRLKPGHPVTITSDVFDGQVFKGKVSFVSPQGDASHNYEVEVAVENTAKHALKSGTFVNVTFDCGTAGNAILVPKTALVDGLKDPYVYVIENGRAVTRQLTLGREVGEQVEVLLGLNTGDVVILTGQLNLSNGSLVEVAK
jgi:RND family efflux transporter MFP subunit